MTLYTVTDWDTKYENNRTRELKRMDWVLVPNKQDGDGYTEIVTMQDGAGLFGCWVAILQVASKCKPRGVLIRENGEPHTAQSISRMSHMPAGLIVRALQVLVSVRWLSSSPYEIPAESRIVMRQTAVPSVPFHSIPIREGGSGETGLPDVEPLRKQLEIHFKRQHGLRWDSEDEHNLALVVRRPDHVSEWGEIVEFRKTAVQNGDRIREQLSSVLSHWSAELDRARNYKPPAKLDRHGRPEPESINLKQIKRMSEG